MTTVRYPLDCERIQTLMVERGHGKFSLEACEIAWEAYSDMLAAGWLFLPQDDEALYRTVKDYLPKVCPTCGARLVDGDET